MCSKEERDKRIREMMEKKTRGKEEKMNKIVEKIIVTENQDAELIKNSYGVTDPNICPQIAEGEKYVRSLDTETRKIIENYMGQGYTLINGSLRRGDEKNIQHIIKILDVAFSHAPPLTHPMTLYRGIKGIQKLRDDNGFSSCSFNKCVSHSFGAGNVFEILVPIGARVLFLGAISACEREVLLDRSGEFREILPGKFVYMTHMFEDKND